MSLKRRDRLCPVCAVALNGEMHPKKADLQQISSLPKMGARGPGRTDRQTAGLLSSTPTGSFWSSKQLSGQDSLQTPGGSTTHPPGIRGTHQRRPGNRWLPRQTSVARACRGRHPREADGPRRQFRSLCHLPQATGEWLPARPASARRGCL